jgi:hypothetical protein
MTKNNTSMIIIPADEKTDLGHSASSSSASASSSASCEEERIYSYPDGTVYMGHMTRVTVENCANAATTTTTYIRNGTGTLRTPAFVYGSSTNEYTVDEAVDKAHLSKWHEYIGTWKNDKLHGYGVHVQKSGDGGELLIFQGIWENGKPTQSVYAKDEDGSYTFDDSVFGW